MAVAQATTTTTQTPRRIIERLSIILVYFVALAAVYLYHHYFVQDGFGPHTFLQTTAGAALGLAISGLGSLYLWYVLLRTRKGQVVRS